MTLKRRISILILILLVFLSFPSGLWAASAFDHSAWDTLLKKYVNEKGDVDYQSVLADREALNGYLDDLMGADGLAMRTSWSREELMAFWLNAYHAGMINLVLEHYPVSSVLKIPSFWDISAVRIGKDPKFQQRFSLNDIRTGKLMNVYHDEKIHLALSMAAKGGPRLLAEAFTGPKVEGQLFLLTRKFVNDPFWVDVTPGKKKIRISRIFKWYGKDFNLDFGVPEPMGRFSNTETAVLSFLAYYLEDETKGEFLQQSKYKIEYPVFDWSLNDQKKTA